jgi:PP-loop superfamily ATP-utilizing enzyme
MNSPKVIRFNNQWTPIKISPKVLETDYMKTNYRKNSSKSCNVFRTNSRRLIHRLAAAYHVHPVFEFSDLSGRMINMERADFLITVKINELDLEVISYASSKRRAWRLLAFKVHREYCNLIQNN